MDEYLETLKIEGRHKEAADYQRRREADRRTTQELASDLRAMGKEVKYRKDGAIEFHI